MPENSLTRLMENGAGQLAAQDLAAAVVDDNHMEFIRPVRFDRLAGSGSTGAGNDIRVDTGFLTGGAAGQNLQHYA